MARKPNVHAARIRAFLKKNPNVKPRFVAEQLGVSVQNVYYVKKWNRQKQRRQENKKVIDLTIAGSPLRPKTPITDKTEFIMPDPVNHPFHYTTGGIETIDFIEAKQLNYNLGNVVKYITRADHKGDRLQDLQKAKWYLEREILAQHI